MGNYREQRLIRLSLTFQPDTQLAAPAINALQTVVTSRIAAL